MGDERVEPSERRIRMRLPASAASSAGSIVSINVARPLRAEGAHVAGAASARTASTMRAGSANPRPRSAASVSSGSRRRRAEIQRGRRRRFVLQQVRKLFEHLGVARAHPGEPVGQRIGEGGGGGEAHEDGEVLQVRGALRQAVGLAVGDHLQPVFDLAEEAVGAPPVRCAARRGMCPARASSRSASSVPARAQPRIAPAPDELQGLHQELDLADAALAQFHVVPQNLSRAARGRGRGAQRRG